MLVSSPAGAGKSTVAATVAAWARERLEEVADGKPVLVLVHHVGCIAAIGVASPPLADGRLRRRRRIQLGMPRPPLAAAQRLDPLAPIALLVRP